MLRLLAVPTDDILPIRGSTLNYLYTGIPHKQKYCEYGNIRSTYWYQVILKYCRELVVLRGT